MYDKLIRQLRNCAIESAPCKACDMVNDDFCTDGLMKQAADAIENTNKAYQMMAEAYEAEVTKQRWIPCRRWPERRCGGSAGGREWGSMATGGGCNMAEYIELIDKYRITQSKDTDYNPPSYEWVDNTGEIVRCKDCVYWQKPQVRLNDGTYRDYEPGEYENGSFFGGVTVDVGINIGSFCAKYNTEHQNCIPQFMGENDFCSKGYKLREES